METKETSSQVRTARRASPSTVSHPQIEGAAPSRGKAAVSTVEIPQYRGRAILAIWAAAALPMGVLAWIIAPPLADNLSGAGNVPMAKALLVLLTAGLIWQFVLVVPSSGASNAPSVGRRSARRSGFVRRKARAAAAPAAGSG